MVEDILTFLQEKGFYELLPRWDKTRVEKLLRSVKDSGEGSSPASVSKLILRVDGASRGNPGPAGIGVVVEDGEGNQLATYYEYIGEATNNEAEYRALIAGLQKVLVMKPRSVEIVMDSELVVKQIQGEYRVKSAGLLPLFKEALDLLGKISRWSIKHVDRAENAMADKLANRAIDLGQ